MENFLVLLVVLSTIAVFFLGSYINSIIRYNRHYYFGNFISIGFDIAFLYAVNTYTLHASIAMFAYTICGFIKFFTLIGYWEDYPNDLWLKNKSKYKYANKHYFFKWFAEHKLIPGYYTK